MIRDAENIMSQNFMVRSVRRTRDHLSSWQVLSQILIYLGKGLDIGIYAKATYRRAGVLAQLEPVGRISCQL
jgi:hypothetical protein